MTEAVQQTLERVRSLSPSEQDEFVEALMISMGRDQAQNDELWYAEARRRFDAYRRGEIGAAPADEVFADLLRARP